MNTTNILKLFTLAAIWGGSFIFMRIVAPAIGAIMTTNMRLLIASFILFAYYALRSIHVDWKSSWKQYVVVGLVNSAIPFTLYAFAIQHIPASYAVVLNTTTPLFAALLAWIWLGEGMTWKKMAGLVIAVFGVAFVVRVGGAGFDDYFYVAVAACLGATICYALAGVYVKKYATHVKPLSMAASSQLIAAILMVPLSVFQPLPQSIGTDIIVNLLGLAILSSAVAYILFYQLVAEIGPTRTMTVAYLMPVFGMIWAAIFLGETITSSMIFGTALVLVGVALVIQTKKPQYKGALVAKNVIARMLKLAYWRHKMLDMRLWCECCAKPLQPNTPEAAICSFECTFCLDCALKLEHICPNCSGVLVLRPTRSLELLKKFPANPMNVKQAKRCP